MSAFTSPRDWQIAQVRAGRCRDCGKRAAAASPGYCRAHKAARKERDEARVQGWVEAGLCLQCGKARTNETTRCDDCCEKRRTYDASYRARGRA